MTPEHAGLAHPFESALVIGRQMAQGVLLVALFAAIAGAARVAQDSTLAWHFGAGPLVDAYYFICSLAAWPVAAALSTWTFLAVPADAALRQSDRAAALHFRGELLGATLLLALVAWPVAGWALRAIVGSPLGGLQAEASVLAQSAVPAMAAVIPLGLIGALLAAWLLAAGRHVLTLQEALPALTLVAVLLLRPDANIFWALAAGTALQLAAMAAVLHAAGELPRPRLRLSSPFWRALAHGALLLLAAQMLFSLVPLVDAFLAARQGEGVLAALSFANRLVLGLQGLMGLALQRAGLPLLAALAATAPEQARHTALRWAVLAAAAGALTGLAVAALAEPLVSLLFERGSFTAADRAQVATLLRHGMLQMPAFLAGTVLGAAVATLRGSAFFGLAAVVGLVVKVAVSVALVNRLGGVGLLWATALMYTAMALMAWFVLRKGRQPARL